MLVNINGVEKTIADLTNNIRSARNKTLEAKIPGIVESLREVTPVDTGNARDSWKATISSGKALITNDTDYIEHLNAGTSSQAPAFFIERTMLTFGKPIGNIVKVIPS